MHFDPEQISDYWRPCQIFRALIQVAGSRDTLTPSEFSRISGVPEDNIDSLIQRNQLPIIQGFFPGLISKEDGFIFLWDIFLAGIKGVPNETK